MSQNGGHDPFLSELNEAEVEYQPWYRDPSNIHPFNLVRKISQNRVDAPAFRTLAMFPWNNDSLSKLWDGSLNTLEYVPEWKKLISEYWDAVAVGSDHNLYVFFTHKTKAPICVKLPARDKQELTPTDTMHIAWSISHNAPFEPIILFSHGSVLYLYSMVHLGIAGFIRGHGGAITSVSSHPTRPHLFCTTSRDFTTRIYDLSLSAVEQKKPTGGKKKKSEKEKVPNPVWPPSNTPSLAGAAHGLRLSQLEGEGSGIGRCIIVLMGGRSGGHQAAVLGAAFHPTYPLIATCGMDRCVKIWLVRSTSNLEVKREDKPVFTSGRVHKARALSISWIEDDLLLTHSAPAMMRVYPNDPNNKETYLEAGELIVWRWLGVDRFFPPGSEELPPTVLRGCSSDYQESASFKFISIHAFPDVSSQFITPNLNFFQTRSDSLVVFVYPGTKDFVLLNLASLSPRKRPLFPLELEKFQAGGTLATATEQMHIAGSQEEGDDGYAGVETEDKRTAMNRRAELAPPSIEGWKIGIDDLDKTLVNCAMGVGGRMIVGVGSNGTLWVWRDDDD